MCRRPLAWGRAAAIPRRPSLVGESREGAENMAGAALLESAQAMTGTQRENPVPRVALTVRRNRIGADGANDLTTLTIELPWPLRREPCCESLLSSCTPRAARASASRTPPKYSWRRNTPKASSLWTRQTTCFPSGRRRVRGSTDGRLAVALRAGGHAVGGRHSRQRACHGNRGGPVPEHGARRPA